jgi:hypothetical protein
MVVTGQILIMISSRCPWLTLFLLLFLGASSASALSYLPGSEAKWTIFRSPHFELLSQVREEKSRTFLHNLEILHALFFARSGESERQPKELTIFYFRSRNDYSAYLPPEMQYRAGALFQKGADRSVILMAEDSTSEETQAVLYRAYVYHLFDIVEERPTPWFQDGLAEFFSTLEKKGDKLHIGRSNAAMLRELGGRPFPSLERLFEIPLPGSPQRLAYDRMDTPVGARAQAWALVHYFQAANGGLDLRQLGKFELYLRSVRDNYDASLAAEKFKELCGISYSDLQARLSDYLKSGRYQISVIDSSIVPAASTFPSGVCPAPLVEMRLGELLYRTTRSPIGKQLLLQAANYNPPDSRALEVLGDGAVKDNDVTLAGEYWRSAIQAGSKNPAIFRELARFASARWFRQFDYDFRMSEEKIDELRALLAKSIEVAPYQQAAYALLAWVEASAPKSSPSNIRLIQQHFSDLGENQRSTLLAVALVYARRGQAKEAERLLVQLESMGTTPDLAKCIQIFRSRLGLVSAQS